MNILGIDPDFHSTAYACLEDGLPTVLGTVKAPKKLTGLRAVTHMVSALAEIDNMPMLDMIIVEIPRVYPKTKVQPNDLVGLAVVAGAAAAAWVGEQGPQCLLRLVHPQEWKGTQPKDVHHRRICTKLGWRFTTSGKNIWPHMSARDKGQIDCNFATSEWYHVLDAIGMAMWGAKKDRLKSRVRDAARRYVQTD